MPNEEGKTFLLRHTGPDRPQTSRVTAHTVSRQRFKPDPAPQVDLQYPFPLCSAPVVWTALPLPPELCGAAGPAPPAAQTHPTSAEYHKPENTRPP